MEHILRFYVVLLFDHLLTQQMKMTSRKEDSLLTRTNPLEWPQHFLFLLGSATFLATWDYRATSALRPFSSFLQKVGWLPKEVSNREYLELKWAYFKNWAKPSFSRVWFVLSLSQAWSEPALSLNQSQAWAEPE